MDAQEFEVRIEAVNRGLEAMKRTAEKEGRDITVTIIALELERDQIIRNFYKTFEDRLPLEEPPGGALVGARIKPTPPTRPGVEAKPFPPQNDSAEI